MIGLICFVLGIALLAYIRLAPTPAERWHQPIAAEQDKSLAGGAIRVRDAGDTDLQNLLDIAEAWPRTHLIAGAVSEGRMTFVTRSFWIGFPDYTTIEIIDGKLKMFARLRFGQRDFGVNAQRLEAWLRKL